MVAPCALTLLVAAATIRIVASLTVADIALIGPPGVPFASSGVVLRTSSCKHVERLEAKSTFCNAGQDVTRPLFPMPARTVYGRTSGARRLSPLTRITRRRPGGNPTESESYAS